MPTTSGTSAARIGRSRKSGAVSMSSGAVAIGGGSLELLVHGAGEFQVLPGLALVSRRAQEVRGMIRHHQRRGTEAVHLAAQPAEGRIRGEQVLRRDAAH